MMYLPVLSKCQIIFTIISPKQNSSTNVHLECRMYLEHLECSNLDCSIHTEYMIIHNQLTTRHIIQHAIIVYEITSVNMARRR